jgi:Flp pilus assembly pilin Flp
MTLIHALRMSLRHERGQTFVEYALILAVVVVGVLLAATRSRLRSTRSRARFNAEIATTRRPTAP